MIWDSLPDLTRSRKNPSTSACHEETPGLEVLEGNFEDVHDH